MKGPINISPQLHLPLDIVTESVAILAIKRVGKSITAKKLFEQLHHAGQQCGAVDPKGDWWGLRSSADGKRPGLPVLILGGDHGDVPLEHTSGELVAKLVVETGVSFVLDLSGFSKTKCAVFMAAFLETLYRLKAKDEYRTPMMLFVDEADAIAPQRPQKGEERMLGACEDIVRRGGQRGIGITLITQRTAVLNKNVLTQCGVLFLLRTSGSQDVHAIDEWIKLHGQPEQRALVLAEIATLPKGTAWVWAPGWPDEHGIFKRVEVDMIETFDSGRTPKPGEKVVRPKTVADVDLDAFRAAMAETIERAKADDPRELRQRIAQLEQELKKKPAPVAAPSAKVKRVEVPTITPDLRKRIESAIATIDKVDVRLAARIEAAIKMSDELNAAAGKLGGLKLELEAALKPAAPTRMTALEARSLAREVRAVPLREIAAGPDRPFTVKRSDAPIADAPGIKSGARRMLRTLATFHPKPLTRAQVGTLSDLSHTTGTFSDYLSALRKAGLVEDHPGGDLGLTAAGVAAAGEPPPPMTSEQLVAMWSSKLKKGARAMLDVLVRAYPNEVSRADVAAGAELSPTTGTFSDYLSALRRNCLIEDCRGGGLRASESLFMGGA